MSKNGKKTNKKSTGRKGAPKKKHRGAVRLRMRRINPIITRERFIAWMKYLKRKEIRLAQLKAIEEKEVFTFDDDEKFCPFKTIVIVGGLKVNLQSLMRDAPSMNLTDPGTIYEFVLSSEHNYSSSAGGIINVALDFDPSTMTEWTNITAMFSLVRIKEASIDIQRAVATAIPTTTSVGAFRPIIFALLRDNAGTAGSYAAIEDSPHTVYNYAFETKGTARNIKYPGPSGEMPLWADTSAPSSATTYVGCPGCCQIYGESMPVSTECLFVVRTLTVQVQNRI